MNLNVGPQTLGMIKFVVVTGVSLACLYCFYNQFDAPKDVTTSLALGLVAYILSFAKSDNMP